MKKDFIWGVGSASYQIEGAPQADGKSPSIWDIFSHTPGKIKYGETGDVACDAYYRFEDDLDLVASLGIPHYRFSLSWPRILPNGDGAVNPAGLNYYDRVVDACLARGITPWITLYHWDLPQTLQERFGGWRGRETAEALGRFAAVVAEHFRGRVAGYYVLNEPQCFVGLGYGIGSHAPGLKLQPEELFPYWHNAMLAYGLAAKAIRTADPSAKIGVASTGSVFCPMTDSAADLEAARTLTMKRVESGWFFSHPMFLDPVCLGRYPDLTALGLQHLVDAVPYEDMEIIHQVPDIIGLNTYHGDQARMGENGPEYVPYPSGYPRNSLSWAIAPSSMYYGPRFVTEAYGIPVLISENGCSCHDRVYPDGQVHDVDRIDFLQKYLAEVERAADDGYCCGYFHWCLTDNFEWSEGYDERFGLIFTDYTTMKRIPKDSAFWYSEHIRNYSDQ